MKFTTLPLILFLMFSCSSDNSDPVPDDKINDPKSDPVITCLPSIITTENLNTGDKVIDSIFFDDLNRISKKISFEDDDFTNGTTIIKEYTFSSNQVIQSSVQSNEPEFPIPQQDYRYVFNDTLLVEIHFFSQFLNQERIVSSFHYSQNGTLEYALRFRDGSVDSIAFGIENANVVSVTIFNDNGSINSVLSFFHDDKNNPYKGSVQLVDDFHDIDLPMSKFLNKNNIINISSSSSSYPRSYSYNDHNYPTTRIDGSWRTEFIYDCVE